MTISKTIPPPPAIGRACPIAQKGKPITSTIAIKY